MMIDEMMMFDRLKITAKAKTAAGTNGFLGELQRRKAAILKGRSQLPFMVADNPNARESGPWYEWKSRSMVSKFPAEIAAAAKATGVDANLIRAIMYMETTHGYYDVVIDNPVVDWIDDINIKHKSIKNKSILPMNMNVDFWGDAFGSRADMHDPMKNIMAGANLLKRIKACMSSSADIARIAAVYNNLGAQKISDHGARVKCIYHKKSWIL